MIVGVGCDILLLSSIKEESLKPGASFLKKVFTKQEIAEGMKRNDSELYFGIRFCGKEAVFKTLHMDGNKGRLNEIEILCDDIGQPQVKLHGTVLQHAKGRCIAEILISLSYDGEYAVAYAIAQDR